VAWGTVETSDPGKAAPLTTKGFLLPQTAGHPGVVGRVVAMIRTWMYS